MGAKQVYVQVRRTLFVDADATRGQQRGTKEVQIGMTVEIPDGEDPSKTTERTYRSVAAQAHAFVMGME